MNEIDFDFWISFATGFSCGIGWATAVYTYMDTRKKIKSKEDRAIRNEAIKQYIEDLRSFNDLVCGDKNESK